MIFYRLVLLQYYVVLHIIIDCLTDSLTQQTGCSLQHNNEINKSLGKAWKEATPEEKRVYEEMSMIDKRWYIKVASF